VFHHGDTIDGCIDSAREAIAGFLEAKEAAMSEEEFRRPL
jgi:predicted RNase H-like HicB family nuclease